MGMRIRFDRPWGDVIPGRDLQIDSDSSVLVDASIELHAAVSARHARGFAEKTGVRMKKGYKGSPYTREELAKIVKAGSAGKTKGWQPENSEQEKESGGEVWYGSREQMGVFADARGIDLDALEKKLEAQGSRAARLLYPRPEKITVQPDGTILGAEEMQGERTAINISTNANFAALHYLHQYQFQLSGAGQLMPQIQNQIDIPAGGGSYTVPLLGPMQFFAQAQLLSETYAAISAVTPSDAQTVFNTQKFMTSAWIEDQFQEDAVADIVPALENGCMIGRGIYTDHVLYRGHAETTAALNINAFGGALALGSKDPRVKINGIQGANWAGTLGGGAAGAFKGLDLQGAQANLKIVAPLLAKLNKYGLNPGQCRFICGANTRAQFLVDAQARPDTFQLLLTMREGQLYAVSGVPVMVLADSQITDASAGGLPTYALWNLEGNPNNLNLAGVYDGVTTNYTTAALWNPSNWLACFKRRFNWLVVKVNLADQTAVVGSERWTAGSVWPSLTEAVVWGLAN